MSARVKRRVEVYVWEPVVRWCHWIIVVCIFVLAITGYLIGNPIPLTQGGELAMGRVRFIHSVTALVFATAVLLRLIWLFVGNQYANWRGLIPVSPQRRKNAFETLKFYLFLRLKSPGSIGHNALAGMAYAAIYILFVIEIVTGYALYTMSSTEGIGWIIRVFGAQEVRLVHHLLTWVFLMFFVHHVYSVFLCAMSERDGLVEAMFDGYKFKEEEKLEAREG
ncbi:MAG TPA: Ni/Fe-hydrogenase, b-type cytochrome subunit [Candidatus Hypogeohydataceae bacterium YC38]|nr:Ni/Fe-hydrogenase, b-type cytochrome subunit [Candidatus Brocadiales bacterium]